MDTGLNEATMNYFASLVELEEKELLGILAIENQFMEYVNVGAGVGGGFKNTNELKPMKYEQAINGPDGEAWKIEIDNEHDRMVKNGVFEVVERNYLPAKTRPIDSIWVCKKKSNGTLRGRLNVRRLK